MNAHNNSHIYIYLYVCNRNKITERKEGVEHKAMKRDFKNQLTRMNGLLFAYFYLLGK